MLFCVASNIYNNHSCIVLVGELGNFATFGDGYNLININFIFLIIYIHITGRADV